jgi:hypothetical protein
LIRLAVLIGDVDGNPKGLELVFVVEGEVHGTGEPLGLIGDHGIESPVLTGGLSQKALDTRSIGRSPRLNVAEFADDSPNPMDAAITCRSL